MDNETSAIKIYVNFATKKVVSVKNRGSKEAIRLQKDGYEYVARVSNNQMFVEPDYFKPEDKYQRFENPDTLTT